ncbi:hypothetical protein [Acinetobacter nosocomialis]|uniref:hypothetical protein n=1 Tax=Acinetobacter nosocomialis TaxID=106654 RepID=UPI0025A94304|nr:hypothetical protein [Acinetobacter nosocomialis]MDM9639383.1 hypothetical protein [Acinetobacter nosocomialis]
MSSMVQVMEKNQVYDASDVAEGYALAYEQVADLAAMVDAIKNKHEKTTEYLKQVYSVPETVFKEFNRLFHITDGLINESLEFSKAQENKYQKEYSNDN